MHGLGLEYPGGIVGIRTDACALPFADGSFDLVCCVEAMFHFPSRAGFLAEAARVLRPTGRLVLTDFAIMAHRPIAPWPDATMVALQEDYGPWPDVWISADNLLALAHKAGFSLETGKDWTAATWPSHRFTAPDSGHPPSPRPNAGDVLRWLHSSGRLRYLALSLRPDIGRSLS